MVTVEREQAATAPETAPNGAPSGVAAGPALPLLPPDTRRLGGEFDVPESGPRTEVRERRPDRRTADRLDPRPQPWAAGKLSLTFSYLLDPGDGTLAVLSRRGSTLPEAPPAVLLALTDPT